MSQCNCKQLQDRYEGKRVEDIKELNTLKRTNVDGMTWRTQYTCEVCQQRWEEYYENKGHGDIPNVRKLK